jgi:hypothetical protein
MTTSDYAGVTPARSTGRMTRTPLRIPLLASAVVLVAAAALTACSAGGGSGSGHSAPVGGATAAGTGSGSGTTTTGYDAKDPCSIASVADVQNAIATTPPVDSDGPDSVATGKPTCFYSSDDALSVIVAIAVVDPSSLDLTTGLFPGDPLTPGSGVGDKSAASSDEIDVIAGSHGIVVESSGKVPLTADQLTAVAKLAVSHLR